MLDRVKNSPIKIYVYPDNLFEYIRNISFSNIISSSGKFPIIMGREDAVINEISFNNSRFNLNQYSDELEPVFKFVKGLDLNNTVFNKKSLVLQAQKTSYCRT